MYFSFFCAFLFSSSPFAILHYVCHASCLMPTCHRLGTKKKKFKMGTVSILLHRNVKRNKVFFPLLEMDEEVKKENLRIVRRKKKKINQQMYVEHTLKKKLHFDRTKWSKLERNWRLVEGKSYIYCVYECLVHISFVQFFKLSALFPSHLLIPFISFIRWHCWCYTICQCLVLCWLCYAAIAVAAVIVLVPFFLKSYICAVFMERTYAIAEYRTQWTKRGLNKSVSEAILVGLFVVGFVCFKLCWVFVWIGRYLFSVPVAHHLIGTFFVFHFNFRFRYSQRRVFSCSFFVLPSGIQFFHYFQKELWKKKQMDHFEFQRTLLSSVFYSDWSVWMNDANTRRRTRRRKKNENWTHHLLKRIWKKWPNYRSRHKNTEMRFKCCF